MSALGRLLLWLALVLGLDSCCHRGACPADNPTGPARTPFKCGDLAVRAAIDDGAGCLQAIDKACKGTEPCNYAGCCNLIRGKQGGQNAEAAVCEPRCSTGVVPPKQTGA